ncbi:hypothetical protein P4B35_19675 [Pontiellaceae bacterium B12227]|nr:hypothetical protein [Pontiellaceae bacterium B12227]
MKKTTLILATALTASLASAESIMRLFNDKGQGTISGRIQSLTMYRDYEGTGNGANSTLGAVVNYTSPVFSGFDAGLGYNYAGEIYENNNSALLANDAINVLNEGWVRYNFYSLNLTNTTLLAGRKIVNGEVFRADDFRQKARSLETVMVESKDISNTRLTIGHAFRMSNWIQVGDRADFNDLNNNDGITWAEAVYSGINELELAVFDAIGWDSVNLIGTRAKYDISEETAILAYLRNESSIGSSSGHHANVLGLSITQKLGAWKLEGGYFGVYGDNLRFQETTTGINHALGASMMIYAQQFAGGADTAYLKAVTKLESTKTVLYALYNYTWQQKLWDGQELNIVIKQPVTENLTVAFKGGIGYRLDKNSIGANTTATDARLFITYAF